MLAITTSLFCCLTAQSNNWDVYLKGFKVKSVAFENDYVWGATDCSLFSFNKKNLNTSYYPLPDYSGDMSSVIKIDKNGVKWVLLTEYRPSGGSLNEQYFSRIYNFDGNHWKKVNLSGYGPYPSMAIDNKNNKWITIGKTLYKIEQDNIILYTAENSGLFYNNVSQVASDKDGNIWVLNTGSHVDLIGHEIELIKTEGDNWISYYSGSAPVFSNMKIDDQGNPWLEWIYVIWKVDMASDFFSEHINAGSAGSSSFHLHAIEGENKCWGTRKVSVNNSWQNKGIAVYFDSDSIFYTTSNSELPSDTVYQIAIESNGTKWFCTAKGLAAFNENGLKSSTDIKANAMKEIEIFPNPAGDYIDIKLPEELYRSIVTILNIQGKTIEINRFDNNQSRLDVSHLPNGIYIVRIESQQNYILKKFIKQ